MARFEDPAADDSRGVARQRRILNGAAFGRAPLRILIVHNRYLQPGGEDLVADAEAALLEEHGHAVCRFETSNHELASWGAAQLAAYPVWNRRSRAQITALQDRFKPDIVHFHNTFPLLSPSVYYTRANVPAALVQTLHNYRLVCPAASLMRSGKPCELCVGRFAWPGVMHACYRNSRSASLATATVVHAHRALGTWRSRVHAYIALTHFTRAIFVRGGLPEDRVHVKPNFVAPDPGVSGKREDHFLFVGRFEEGKGIRVLLDAWSRMSDAPRLRIVGGGELEKDVATFAAGRSNVEVLGTLPREQVMQELKAARALIAPMLWYENFPLTVCEAMATGCPIIASDQPNIRAILRNGAAGALFPPGDADALCEATVAAATQPDRLRQAAVHARRLYESHYTAEANYQMLLGIYASAIQAAKTRT